MFLLSFAASPIKMKNDKMKVMYAVSKMANATVEKIID
ncbi:LOW QUALITY PROTEIN: hypothetical protein PanWU01x14_287060 [Parasponia andersonii]|uniref:Uncharacterized protein n=1 Tax=Parasponia andersonii TaxID=3476 RepID=A0A2P5AZ18_PARAD|nr:LOW QUALITY PROTEIN: hypothetical protein PanWU01x14_287060 [Parasponia andersonii]